MTVCPVCESSRTSEFLRRSQVPVHQNLLLPDAESARALARGELQLCVCEDCGFIFNRAFDPALLQYGAEYDNTQTCSPAFRTHIDGLVQHLVDARGVRACAIVEVGCGKGEFLLRLIEADADNCGVGFDPSYDGPEVRCGGRLRFRRSFYDAPAAPETADVVICRHVIEHVADPVALLSLMRSVLRARRGRVYLETPCVAWVLRNRVLWDFFYEHCSYFTAESLTTACARAGLQVADASHVFGGQYLWLEASLADEMNLGTNAGSVPALARDFAEDEQKIRASLLDLVTARCNNRRVALWGAGAKGVTLAHLLDPGCARLDCVVDLNPNKQEHFLPGTGLPIVAAADLPKRGVTAALLLNPNYRDEILALLRHARLEVELIDLMTA